MPLYVYLCPKCSNIRLIPRKKCHDKLFCRVCKKTYNKDESIVWDGKKLPIKINRMSPYTLRLRYKEQSYKNRLYVKKIESLVRKLREKKRFVWLLINNKDKSVEGVFENKMDVRRYMTRKKFFNFKEKFYTSADENNYKNDNYYVVEKREIIK